MDLEEKARENLEAAERLQPDGHDFFGLPNAAASRAYYAAYLAVAHCALGRGRLFTSGRGYFRHDTLPGKALTWSILDEDGRDVLELLQGRRVKADYYEDLVSLEEASEAYDQAKWLLNELGMQA